MTDVLDELRTLNPARIDGLALPEALEHLPLAPRPRRRRTAAILVSAVAAITAAGVLLALGGGSTPDLAARAYAATSGPGLVHWRIEITEAADGRPVGCCGRRVEGWASGDRSRVADYMVRHDGSQRLIDEQVIAYGHLLIYNAHTGEVSHEPALDAADFLPSQGDPMHAFRSAFVGHHLRKVSATRYRVALPGMQRAREVVVYDLDPKTATPTGLVITVATPPAPGRRAHRYRSTWRFALYEHVADTERNRRHLVLDRRPVKPLPMSDTIDHFAVLRHQRIPPRSIQQRLRQTAAAAPQLRLDPGRARTVAHGVWAIPGRGHICLEVQERHSSGIAGGCTTILDAISHGVSVGQGGGQLLVLVPDDITTIRARLPAHAWRRFIVRRSLVRLPNLGYHWRLVRP